jgi:hypothetical protein
MIHILTCFHFSATFKEKTEEEWVEMKKNLQPIIDELAEDDENGSTPSSLISEEDTMDMLV